MKLAKADRDALVAWMKAERLNQLAVAKIMQVTHVSVMKWIKGGGIRPSQMARLRPMITPHVKFDIISQPTQELSALRAKIQRHVGSHPDLVHLYSTVLDQIEDFISRYDQSGNARS